ncbi:uncharacterized protein HGUI_03221 [Hanseniaspora guilliermondii]|uniref:DNA polymerase delta small subunit n=1 Tax=Hanseniaspora guilliermondii TaxID=56406 RepID=A0A1L0CPW7_9ASCO|nr:uncharacterized protein HGUI_03221 [Hanseniaspora guilliermondii]
MANILEKFLNTTNNLKSFDDLNATKVIGVNSGSNIFSDLIEHSDKYTSSNKGSMNQYFNIYNNRLNYFKPRIINNAKSIFGSSIKVTSKVLDIQPTLLSQSIKLDQPKDSINTKGLIFTVGTIYTEMKYKPDILNQVSKDIYGMPESPSHYTIQNDSDRADFSQNSEMLLEDESGRVVLKFDHFEAPKDILVTGVVVGIRGFVDVDNCLQVLDCCYPEALSNKDLKIEDDEDSKILLISGLNIDKDTNLPLLQKLQEFLAGVSKNTKVSRNVVFLGDSLTNYTNLNIMNDFLLTLIKSKTLTIIPSFNDPSDKALPQRPINMKLFERKLQINSNKLICSETNPFYLDKYRVILESGDSINDIVKYGDYDGIESRSEILKGFIKWQNLVPTAPDTLNIMPFDINEKQDPFVLKESYPKSLIVGNQPELININYNNVQILGIPIFSKTKQVVELDLKTLDYEIIQL